MKTPDKKERLLKAKIAVALQNEYAVALQNEYDRVPTSEEIESVFHFTPHPGDV